MKFGTFRRGTADETFVGAIRGDGVFDLTAAAGSARPSFASDTAMTMLTLLAAGQAGAEWAGTVVDRLDRSEPIDSLHVEFPIPVVEKFIGIGLNYRDHAEEQGARIPRQPIAFAKFSNSFTGPFDPIRMPKSSTALDYEAELGVVIGLPGRDIPASRALAHVGGYCVVNDVTARDVQLAERQWVRGKTFDRTTPVGPWITTPDEVPRPDALRVRLWIGGDLIQDGSTADMIFSVAEIIAHVSQDVTLRPGDIIATGTPSGVGFVKDPPLYLKPGDVVTTEVEGLGRLVNRVES